MGFGGHIQQMNPLLRWGRAWFHFFFFGGVLARKPPKPKQTHRFLCFSETRLVGE
jgi:hypothetical protein